MEGKAKELKRKTSVRGVLLVKVRREKMLEYLKDNEDVIVGLSELKEQLEMPEEAGISFMRIAKQARNERGQALQARRERGAHRQFGEVVYITERIGGAGKALSGSDAGGEFVKRKTRSPGCLGGRQE